MKHFKGIILILLLLSLVSCGKPNPANLINEQLKVIMTQNNKTLNALNMVTKHQQDLQPLLMSDLNQEALSDENSQLLEHLNKRKAELDLVKPEIEAYKETLNQLNEIDLEHLEQGHSELDTLKESISNIITDYESILSAYTQQFESEQNLINLIKQDQPSIQEFDDAIKQVNQQSKNIVDELTNFKQLNDSLKTSVQKWETSIEEVDETNKLVDVDQIESKPIEHPQPEPDPVKEPEITPKYTMTENFSVKALDSSNTQPLALLTFDDSVQPEPNSYSLEIAKTLKEKGVSAIFFVNGMFLESDHGKDHLKQIHDLGFTIGNHTYSHPYLNQITLEQTREEIVKTNDMVEEITGVRPTIFRPSYGIMGEHTETVLNEEGMIWMNWSFGYDWEAEYMEGDALADIMVNTPLLSSGANLLMHDRKWTAEAIGRIVDGLVDKGYHIVNPLEIETRGTNHE